jgi:diguanylate cyclase (GGDEF)-like protein
MESIFGFRVRKPNPSPLEGFAGDRAQQGESSLRQIGRREWWLWLSASVVTLLAGVAFLLSSFRSFFLFLRSDHFYEIRSDQARWGIMCLLLLFNTWMVYRQWSFRRLRRQMTEQSGNPEGNIQEVHDASGVDPVTGLDTRASLDQCLGKEIARARRQNTALSVIKFHLEDFAKLNDRYGRAATDEALKEFARRLKEASRGSDYAVRLGSDDFLLVLPKCTLGETKLVLDRLRSVEVNCSGKRIILAYTTGCADYQPGDLPADVLKRAEQILQLYSKASNDAFSTVKG